MEWLLLDIYILTRRKKEHISRREKFAQDQKLGVEIQGEGQTHTHRVLFDKKGYQGLHKVMRCIVLFKKPPNLYLILTQERFKDKLSSDRIIVEHCLSRMQAL